MTLSRRDFLRAGGLAATALSASACSAVGRHLAQQTIPPQLAANTSADPSTRRIHRLLNRGGYGPRPGDVAVVQQKGFDAYLEEQLNPETVDDTPADLLLRNLSLYHMGIDQLLAWDRREVGRDLARATLIRAITSRRQLYEAMVEFWSDHFNIYILKNKQMPYFKLVDDRDLIRPHALGNFRDLLLASARSPAMLIYLDNVSNVASAPNENYARELMELHTLGVHGGYTQEDVQELARALTGWGVAKRGRKQGQFTFDAGQHDPDEKNILGQELKGNAGRDEVLNFLDVLATHPSTAHFIATKLVTHFVADEPPSGLVETVAQTYLNTGADIKSMLRSVFLSDEFANAPPKLKRPYHYAISALRGLHADVGVGGYRQLTSALTELGQVPFHWPMPDGYPSTAHAWTGNVLARWNFALDLLGGEFDGIHLPFEKLIEAGNVTDAQSALTLFSALLLGAPQEPDTISQIAEFVGTGDLSKRPVRRRLKDAIVLLMAGPDFQWI